MHRSYPWVLILISLCAPLSAQDAAPSTSSSWTPSILVGGSWFMADLEDPATAPGAVLRAGAAVGGLGLGLSAARWPDVASFDLLGAQLEFDVALDDGRGLSPHLLSAVGYTRGRYRGSGPATPPDGASAAYGLGFRARASSALALRVDGLVRTDDGGWNAELRLLGGWSPATAASTSLAWVEAELLWMVPVTGPWELVAPAYGVAVGRPLQDRLAGVLSLAVVHWRIPADGDARAYLWDTRMLLAAPAIEWDADGLPLVVRAGPAIAAMGEGPDSGASPGAHARAALTVAPLGLDLRVGLGVLWLARDGGADTGVDGADQLGLTVGAALRL